MKALKKFLVPASILFIFIFFLSACKNSDSVVQADENLTEHEALLKLADEDEVLSSFEPNYNEEDAMEMLGGTLAKAIYPVRVGHKMRLIDRELVVDFVGDTAIGVMTRTYEGILIIAASYDEFTLEPGVRPDSGLVDTVIEKSFSSVVTHNIKYAKLQNTGITERDWKIIAVSLPEGGTGSQNIIIQKMTFYLPDNEEITIDSPNDYYLERMPGWRRQVPNLNRGEEVRIVVQLESAYADTDFVTLTYGAIKGGRHHRAKKRFELVSEEQIGGKFVRIYQQSWILKQVPGYKHAIIRAVPKQVLFDDEAEVEVHTWGMPYTVR